MIYSVLITEDDPVTALMEQQIVKKLGYHIAGNAIDAKNAFELVESEKPDVVLMDINLPGEIDGITAADHIATQYGIPVIYVTGHADDETMRRAVESSSFGYIIKPLKPEILYTTIEMTMQRHLLERKLKSSQNNLKQLNEQLEEKVRERTAELQLNNQMLESEIDRRKEIELNLKEALAREKELNELKSRIVTIVSHELKTPLTTILSSNELIAFHVDNNAPIEKILGHTRTIDRTVHELTGMINDSLFLSKADAGKVKLQKQEVNFKYFIENLVDGFQTGFGKSHQLNLNINCEPNHLMLDEGLLKTSCNNLVSNAIKYSDEGTSIDINVNCSDDKLIIEVADHGIGIPAGDQDHLFELFHRASNTINIEGSGIGLAIVKRCVDMMEGDISLTSTEGEGTTFILSIPLNKPVIG